MYLPWAGYFEQIASVDHFVLLDDVQYTKQDWRNRNRIKTINGPRWLTVPIRRTRTATLINEIEIDYDRDWIGKHLRIIEANYRRSAFFEPLYGQLASVLSRRYTYLSDLNEMLIRVAMRHLGISTEISLASTVERDRARYGPGTDQRNERLLEICEHFGASVFYDGKSAASFIDSRKFKEIGVNVVFQDYTPAAYSQAFGGFLSHMSVIDLVMNTGPEARRILLAPGGAGAMLRCSTIAPADVSE